MSRCPFLEKKCHIEWRYFNGFAKTLRRLGIVDMMCLDGWTEAREINDDLVIIEVERVEVDVIVDDVCRTYLIYEREVVLD